MYVKYIASFPFFLPFNIKASVLFGASLVYGFQSSINYSQIFIDVSCKHPIVGCCEHKVIIILDMISCSMKLKQTSHYTKYSTG